MAEFVSTLISNVFIALVSSLFAVYFSLRRFRSEKWWERRAETYERIIEALYHLRRLLDHHQRDL
jgi:hypothetical protein